MINFTFVDDCLLFISLFLLLLAARGYIMLLLLLFAFFLLRGLRVGLSTYHTIDTIPTIFFTTHTLCCIVYRSICKTQSCKSFSLFVAVCRLAACRLPTQPEVLAAVGSCSLQVAARTSQSKARKKIIR